MPIKQKGQHFINSQRLLAAIKEGIDFMITKKDMMGKSIMEIGGIGKLVSHKNL